MNLHRLIEILSNILQNNLVNDRKLERERSDNREIFNFIKMELRNGNSMRGQKMINDYVSIDSRIIK